MLTVINKRPQFNLFSDSFFASYQLEISNLRIQRVMLERCLDHSKDLEEQILKTFQSQETDEEIQYSPIQKISLTSEVFQ
jgi:hypothetical protein